MLAPAEGAAANHALDPGPAARHGKDRASFTTDHADRAPALAACEEIESPQLHFVIPAKERVKKFGAHHK